MFFRLFTKAALACAILIASIYAPLQAQQDSTTQAPQKSDRPFWIWQYMAKSQPGGMEDGFNQRLAKDLKGDTPQFGSGFFVIAPFNIMWNHNRWILFGSYYFAAPYVQLIGPGERLSTNEYRGSRFFHEITTGVGYAIVNAPRFRLYPSIAFTGASDIITITEKTSFTSLLANLNERSITFERSASIISEIAIGADYSFPIEYGDIYIMTKIGYNFHGGGRWTVGASIMEDTDPNWFSRRGVFFQIGVGFGTERH